MTKQTLEEGTLVADTYGHFGVRGLDECVDPAFAFVELIGEGGTGKTSLLRDHPGCLIFNTDLHPVPKPTPTAPPAKAGFFPAKDGKGRLLVVKNGKVESIPRLTWDLILAEQKRIIEAVDAGRPHPATVAFDTGASCMPLVIDWIARTRNRFKKYGGIDDIPDGDPMQALYGCAYDHFVRVMAELLAAGVGVYVIGHRIRRTIRTSSGEEVYTTSNIPEKVRARYFSNLDMLMEVEMHSEATRVDGKATFRTKRMLCAPPEDSKETFRVRVPIKLPWEIPAIGAWDAFRKLCLEAAGTKE